MSRSLVALLGASVALTSSALAGTTDLTLASGETLSVEIISIDDQTIHARHAVLGTLALDRDRVSLPAADSEAAAVALGMIQDDAEAMADEKEWETSVVIGAGFATGNTENANLAATLVTTRETTETITTFDLGYFFASSEGDRTDNKFTAGFENDWLVPDSRWFYFADARFDYDEFQSWESRVNGHVGVGYELIKKDDFWLNGRVGIGAVREFNSDNEDVRPEALAGLRGEWKISEKQTLDFSTTIYPDLDETGEFRWTSAANWSVMLDEETNMSLNAGIANEYQSKVSEGSEHNDLRAYAGLQFDF